MNKITSKKVTQYFLEVVCKCKRKTTFHLATGDRISKKELQYKIPTGEWNGWIVKTGEEKCPICQLNELEQKRLSIKRKIINL